jgi:NHL repeat
MIRRFTLGWLTLLLLVSPFEPSRTVVAASTYRLLDNWGTGMPAGGVFGRVSGVTSDGSGHVLVYRRDGGNVWTFDAAGRFLEVWGANGAKRTHAIRGDRNGFAWTTDDQGHQIKKWSADRKVLLTLGTYDTAGETASTFNGPTDVAVAANGDIFVADGYVNSRVAKFTKDGRFVKAWGQKGSEPGQFNLPHSIIIDARGRVPVADRENHRIQIFDQDGKVLDSWSHFGEPVALDIRDDVLFVADGNASKVWIGNAKDGTIIDSIETDGNQHALAVDRVAPTSVACSTPPSCRTVVGCIRRRWRREGVRDARGRATRRAATYRPIERRRVLPPWVNPRGCTDEFGAGPIDRNATSFGCSWGTIGNSPPTGRIASPKAWCSRN